MGKAISLPLREQIVALKQTGNTLQAIHQQLSLSFGTIRSIWKRFTQHGQAGLGTHFDHCGGKPPAATNQIFRAARWLRYRHPEWGSPIFIPCYSSGMASPYPPSVHSTDGTKRAA
ncbi:hypothetical protein GO730_38200 [Spirosoma sp. HMF3257]|uniref:Uncharacterized protein n=1 Tax=Spirosoma telluris TaxID=2183553 RepID=A0A327NG69_9BACT|nr:hypothetical protein [Spirosoma telluris]RAI72946.1 hypothetical protein HMF3257_38105 [Spirosoma telluris]